MRTLFWVLAFIVMLSVSPIIVAAVAIGWLVAHRKEWT